MPFHIVAENVKTATLDKDAVDHLLLGRGYQMAASRMRITVYAPSRAPALCAARSKISLTCSAPKHFILNISAAFVSELLSSAPVLFRLYVPFPLPSFLLYLPSKMEDFPFSLMFFKVFVWIICRKTDKKLLFSTIF